MKGKGIWCWVWGIVGVVWAGTAKLPDLPPQDLPPPAVTPDWLVAMASRHGEDAAREYRLLKREMTTKPMTLSGTVDAAARLAQTFHQQAAILPTDRDPLDVVLRRTRALYEDLAPQVELTAAGARLAELEAEARGVAAVDVPARADCFGRVVALRKTIAFANPLLKGIDRILFITREALPPNEFDWGVHMCDQYYGFHATVHGTTQGNGLYVLHAPWSERPRAQNLLAESMIESGARKGQKLGNGGYLSPDLSYDGRQILFAYTDGEPQIRVWNEKTTFHLFRCNADGSGLVQLTDGNVNDFDPCWLPNGRIAFISERRGGYGRCHGRLVPTYTLHSMFEDGSDIVAISVHETNEWQPSVDNNGMIVYTRWDYVDRGFNQAHHPWITYPDGRDARELQGNFHLSERTAPHMVMDLRAIPGSSKYVAIACGHHTEARGSVIILDPTLPDDGAMSQIRRFTPDQLMPEAEYYDWKTTKGSAAYASPWPLSERYMLCVYDGDANAQYGVIDYKKRRYAITLLDAFGNKIPLYTHPQISCLSPIPLVPRPRPPVLTHGTQTGRPRLPNGAKPAPIPEAERTSKATVGLINVYNSRYPFPAGTVITALRVWQILPKTEPIVGKPRLGVCDQTPGRQFLGTVPVEKDGSAFFEVPAGVPILFHAVNEKGAAVQGMRSLTYTAPGETLMCAGCHESRTGAAARDTVSSKPVAMRRAPSVLRPGPDGSNPFNYPRLVQPVLDARCVTCHGADRKEGMPDLRKGEVAKNRYRFHTSFVSLVPYVCYYTLMYHGPGWLTMGVQRDSFVEPFTLPGRFGSYASRLHAMLAKGHHNVKLTEEENLRLTLFMDSNAAYFGHDHELERQALGEIVHPVLQ
ncbi:MAG TPA: hypothetical protein PLH01_06885 [Kiritimatiellia bacterium]|nr:hypothetical protein [Kiritimatiellia bacterium]